MSMTSRARWVVLVAAALMATAYVLPLWRVELIAPQYPEGLGMLIRINGVEGIKPQDLNSINNLNHYIGMKAIVPDAIPELKWMPWILGALVAGGVLVAALGRRVPLNVWGIALGLVLVVGLYDYWRWGYDYGHDLDMKTAIIKIPGMTYQPPLIGSKKLLNFRATSWPATGGIALSLGAGLVAIAMWDTRRRRTSAPREREA
jgi:copper chaperone NosL